MSAEHVIKPFAAKQPVVTAAALENIDFAATAEQQGRYVRAIRLER